MAMSLWEVPVGRLPEWMIWDIERERKEREAEVGRGLWLPMPMPPGREVEKKEIWK